MGKAVEKSRELWDNWQVEAYVISSLLLQIILFLLAPSRKRNSTPAKWARPFIWWAYLQADSVAISALGLLLSRLSKDYYVLYAFWSTFLLLHFGGPDTITALAIDDNELWPRHLLMLLVPLVNASYILYRSRHKNPLLLATSLLLVASTGRYLERTYSFYLASNDHLKRVLRTPASGMNYAKLIEEHTMYKEAGIPTSIEIPYESHPTSIEIRDDSPPVITAIRFFRTFRCIIFDLHVQFNMRNLSRDFFLRKSADVAFDMMDIELGFAYDILYSKAAVFHRPIGYIIRILCVSFILYAFCRFFSCFDKIEIRTVDIIVTYALIICTSFLELMNLCRLIFSDWMLIVLSKHPVMLSNHLVRLSNRLVMFTTAAKPKYISQYNLINACLYEHQHKMISSIWWLKKYYLDKFKHPTNELVCDNLKNFIFQELKKKSEAAIDFNNTMRLCSYRGDWALHRWGRYADFGWTVEVEFEESILLWHIATDLCYHPEQTGNSTAPPAIHISVAICRQVSKLISEYMLYLLVLHPQMISSMEGIHHVKYQDACQEVFSFIKTKSLKDQNSTRNELLSLSSVMQGKSKLVLFDACFLAKKLNELNEERRWKIVSEVWVELLIYAASQCQGEEHARGLTRGGELLTHVWFLMAHMGLGNYYHDVPSHAKATLVLE